MILALRTGDKWVRESMDASLWSFLNRLTETSTYEFVNDVLGNRTARITKSNQGQITYEWDELNRLVLQNGVRHYQFRADGMRVKKSRTGSGQTTTRYRYDGQMGVQDVVSLTANGTVQHVIDNGLGARGVDVMTKTVSGTPSTFFPVYDSHGNMVATLSRNGTGYVIADQRRYDAWGVTRIGNNTGDPQSGYVANLGHRKDDETDFVYMRARFYEPSRGRFISEDPSGDGLNWYAYCGNDPVNRVDEDGRSWKSISAMFGVAIASFFMFLRVLGEWFNTWRGSSVCGCHRLWCCEWVWCLQDHAGLGLRAATDFMKIMGNRLSYDVDPKRPSLRLVKASIATAFYFGYFMFLFFVMNQINEESSKS